MTHKGHGVPAPSPAQKSPKKPTLCLRALSKYFLNSGWLGVQCPFLERADLFLHLQASCNSPPQYKNELFCGAVTDACMLNVCHNKAEVNRTSVHACHVRLVKTSLGICKLLPF